MNGDCSSCSLWWPYIVYVFAYQHQSNSYVGMVCNDVVQAKLFFDQDGGGSERI